MKTKIFAFPVVIGLVLIFLFASIYFLRINSFNSSPASIDSLKKNLPKVILKNLNKKYGFDRPWHEKYLEFLGQSLIYDLGSSYRHLNFTVNQLIALRTPMSGLFMAVAGILILVSLFMRSKRPYKTWVRLFQVCALILLSVVNMYFIYEYALKAVIAMLVFIGCLLFLVFRRDHTIVNYASSVLVILSLFQLFIFENILGIKGISFYLQGAARNRDYTLIWGTQYTQFLLATLAGVLIAYIGVYFFKNRG